MSNTTESDIDKTEEKVEQKKEKKSKHTNDKAPKKKKGKGIFIVLIFLVLLISILVSILGFNVFDIREKYLRNTIEKIPIIRDILPAKTGEDIEIPATVEELQKKISELEKQIETQNNTITTLTDNNNSLDLENKRLKEIETKQVEFKTTKEEFDKLIAENDPDAYSKFYEQISPENAENLYTATKMSAEQTKELKKYTDTFVTIDPDAGARIIEEMIGTDMNLASLILKNIDSEQRSNIISAMDYVKATSIVKYMAPN